MNESMPSLEMLVLITGVLVLLVASLRHGLKKLHLPPLVGFLLLGILLRLADQQLEFMAGISYEVLHFLGMLGVIALLFRIGLNSNLRGLLGQLRSASLAWGANVLLSAVLGFVTAFYLLGLAFVPSLVIAVALTATSVAMPASVWQESGRLKTRPGKLLLDLAELDDITGVLLMAVLFAVLPALHGAESSLTGTALLGKLGLVVGLIILFAGLCILFGLWLEKPFVRLLDAISEEPYFSLGIIGFSITLAALAAMFGLSVAIGAFFAGLLFSGESKRDEINETFKPTYALLAPFFFISIGLSLNPAVLGSALGAGLLLLAAATVGKLIGAGAAVLPATGRMAALAIGASMVPRAEITLLIMQKARQLGSWAASDRVYAAMVLVSAATCIIAPPVLYIILGKLPRWESGA